MNCVRYYVLFVLLMALPVYSAEEFKWDLDDDTEDAGSPRLKLPKSKIPPPEKVSVKTQGKQDGVDGSALKKLIDDNLMLRKKIARSEQDSQAAHQQNTRLSAQVRGVEQSLAQSIAKIRDLNKQKAASNENVDKVIDLERRLTDAEKDKRKISGELSALRKRIVEMESALPPVVLPEVAPSIVSAPEPESDLFKELQKENVLLKQKWVDVETERQKAVKTLKALAKKNKKAEKKAATAVVRETEAKKKLSAEKHKRKDLNALLKRMPGLEKELNLNKTEVAKKGLEVAEKKKHLKALMIELELREARLIKAERMQKIMAQAREELRQVGDAEKRDMHYNMAAVYAKEGRFRFAEREYLRALQVDPNDAGVHYNLGILYDDDLKNKRRAAIHYRKYLKLNPYGTDVDQIKGWLLQIEMKK
ncbi:MAG: tetratricopeptide repeat protein [Kiritimatiellae bacterium]|nr:tetratricopeptide repeat protein [Kiritimatiellia bacterium]